jgi:CubicO group peptidase (beta-lactamase class C family)
MYPDLRNFSFSKCILISVPLVFISGFISCDQYQTKKHPLDTKFDAYVEQTLKDWKAPGVVISVVKDGEHVFAKGYGTRKFGKNLPINRKTLFQIASHTKPITASTVAILVDEGKMSWDDPVNKHIPEFNLKDNYAAKNLTVRDLLMQRTYFPPSVGGFYDPDYTISDLLSDLEKSKPLTGFRERQNYSNVAFALAGEVVARVSGIGWEEFVKLRILEPLGMSSTYTSTTELQSKLGDPDNVDNIFKPAVMKDGVVSLGDWRACSCDHLYAPAAGVITTADDIAKWMILQLQEGEYKGKQLISRESVKEMHKPHVIITPFWGSARFNWFDYHNPLAHFLTYGLGWISFDYMGKKVDEHPGGFMGSVVAVISEENLGIAVGTNTNFGFESLKIASAIKMKIIDLFLGVPDKDWSSIFLETQNR